MPKTYRQDPHPALCPCDVCEGRAPKVKRRDYASTVARMAGNIAVGLVTHHNYDPGGSETGLAARKAVALARAIIDEVKRTEPRDRQEPR